eukprot:CAMPEP_0115857522 /NCGR_PEP_ID=MMETSP0287-20121206/15618_1 /TAXON_ID=412157 /ORGANISM="Chrysochromulina rotalis, Strain UIO044" /LENGTH=103 /DNA_ID=CAMNT_0003311743 /DNA_START=715 /DNA_END=1026 /DNA_ORIENTATION=-
MATRHRRAAKAPGCVARDLSCAARLVQTVARTLTAPQAKSWVALLLFQAPQEAAASAPQARVSQAIPAILSLSGRRSQLLAAVPIHPHTSASATAHPNPSRPG